MKHMKNKYIIGLSIFIGCWDICLQQRFSDKKPLGTLNQAVLANQSGVEGLLIGAYHQLGGNNNWGSAPFQLVIWQCGC